VRAEVFKRLSCRDFFVASTGTPREAFGPRRRMHKDDDHGRRSHDRP